MNWTHVWEVVMGLSIFTFINAIVTIIVNLIGHAGLRFIKKNKPEVHAPSIHDPPIYDPEDKL